jgi:putative ATPase
MDELFPPPVDDSMAAADSAERSGWDEPLASRMRPRSLDEYVGQDHLLGTGRLLRRAVESDRFASLIFYGPPGVGKTSLAQIIASHTQARFLRLNGVESNVSDIRKAAETAEAERRLRKRGTILFVDEIHRFNKAQQDVLLPLVERGALRFIGATTQNPFFYINSPLVSRSQVFALEPIPEAAVVELLVRALADSERGLGKFRVQAAPEALRHLAVMADGDARKALTALELAVMTTPPDAHGAIGITLEVAEESVQKKTVVYDGEGDAHYDTASAFIKSIRGSDPDAALYWLAKMLHVGEDPRFIARRLVIAASEDIGLADSQGLLVAVAALQALEFVGMPEGRIPLAHATVHLATAPKSNRAYAALNAAQQDVATGRTLAVPAHLKDPRVPGHAPGYQYSHEAPTGFIPQAFLPEGRRYYEPTENGQEKRIKERLDYWRAQFDAARPAPPEPPSASTPRH